MTYSLARALRVGRCERPAQPGEAEHSDSEDRFIAIGPIERGLVVIVYTERDEDIIRIIGARWANAREQSLYRSYMDQNR